MLHDPARRAVRDIAERRVAVVLDGDLAHAPESLRRARQRLVEQFADLSPESKVRVPDDPGAEAAIAIHTAGTHRTDAVGEFDLPQRAKELWPVGTRERQSFHIH